jgi:hypothetical protein
MNKKAKPFAPKAFLTKAGGGKTISKYQIDQPVFSQGDPADSVFYIQSGKVKVTVVSEQGKEAVVAILGPNEFVRRRLPSRPAATHGDRYCNDGIRDYAAGEAGHDPCTP